MVRYYYQSVGDALSNLQAGIDLEEGQGQVAIPMANQGQAGWVNIEASPQAEAPCWWFGSRCIHFLILVLLIVLYLASLFWLETNSS
jgi:hypothetical protein